MPKVHKSTFKHLAAMGIAAISAMVLLLPLSNANAEEPSAQSTCTIGTSTITDCFPDEGLRFEVMSAIGHASPTDTLTQAKANRVVQINMHSPSLVTDISALQYFTNLTFLRLKSDGSASSFSDITPNGSSPELIPNTTPTLGTIPTLGTTPTLTSDPPRPYIHSDVGRANSGNRIAKAAGNATNTGQGTEPDASHGARTAEADTNDRAGSSIRATASASGQAVARTDTGASDRAGSGAGFRASEARNDRQQYHRHRRRACDDAGVRSGTRNHQQAQGLGSTLVPMST